MSDTLGLLVPICALSLVCVGLLAVVAFIAVRFLGFAMPGWLDHYKDMLGGQPADLPYVQPSQRRRTSLRDQVTDLDFDAAVARQQAEKNPKSPPGFTPSIGAQSAGDQTDFSTPSLRRKRRRKEGYSEDEIHGGLLDEDGDGDLDF